MHIYIYKLWPDSPLSVVASLYRYSFKQFASFL